MFSFRTQEGRFVVHDKMTVPLPVPPELELPTAYQRVEFLEAHGTEYIDTGYDGANRSVNNMRVELDFEFTNVLGKQRIIGKYGNKNRLLIGVEDGVFLLAVGDLVYTTITADTAKHNVILDGVANKYYFDGVQGNLSRNTYRPLGSNTILLFAYHGSTTTAIENKANCRLYLCKMYEAGAIVRCFVPCYRKADNVRGLFDTVNQVFYTNKGTGVFDVGEDINPVEVKDVKLFAME